MNGLNGIGLLVLGVVLVACVGTESDVRGGVYVEDDGMDTAAGADTGTGSGGGGTGDITDTGAGGSSGSGHGASDSDTNPPVPVCDNSGNCWGSCWGCAAEHLCRNGQAACLAHSGCAALQTCVAACPDTGWWDCYVGCGGDTNSQAEQLLQAFWDCIYCGACKNDCRNSGHDCSHFTDTGTGTGTDTEIPDDGLTWRQANLSWYQSYPDPGSDECINYNGCLWAGYFAALPNQMPESWVAANNIIAVHENHFNTYRLKTLRVRQMTTQGLRTIDAVVYDKCADSDCNGCCTRNMSATGFLIDMEIYTLNRLGGHHGIAEWACLDC